MTTDTTYTIGIDFGSDSVRSILVDTATGKCIAEYTHNYTRWGHQMYCDPSISQFRQHPSDYLEGMEIVIREVVSLCPSPDAIKAISIDSTSSTPCIVDSSLTPLCMLDEYRENPDAMFILWKDHTAESEAVLINRHIGSAKENYARHTGGYYSAECFWAKILHVLKHSPELKKKAFTAVELCDWTTAQLTGVTNAQELRSSLCAAGSKKMWAEEWGGYPPLEFFESFAKQLTPIARNLPGKVYDCTKSAGNLCRDWAIKTGLTTDVVIGIGNIDAHSGAVGAGIAEGTMALNLGTSSCYMAVMKDKSFRRKMIDGIFGQVYGSILPGMTGFEAGMSAFGDIFAWIERMHRWSFGDLNIPEVEELKHNMLSRFTEEAMKIEPDISLPLATDYLNGRRSPSPDSKLKATVTGLTLSTTPAQVFYALAEAAAFGTKAIIEHLSANGVKIVKLVAVGGITHKSPFIMQMLADVTGRELEVSASNQSCALGAAINASVACGLQKNVEEAQKAMCPPAETAYKPNRSRRDILLERYHKYLKLSKIK